MKSALFPFCVFLLCPAGPLCAGVSVAVGEISDKRTTGEFFSGLEIKLLVSGPEMATAKGMRCTIEKAVDDTGKNLLDGRKSGFREGEFEPLEKPFGSKPKKADEFETAINLVNPPRSAKSVSLVGKIELLSPGADPASVIKAELSKVAGKPLEDAVLKSAGVEITFEAPKGDGVSYKLKDPGKKVAAVEFCGADGKPLKTSGSSSFGFGGARTCSVDIPNLPQQVTIQIQLLTEKAVVAVPVKLEAIELP